jgi:alkylation response protein AidB-like acyl-CoA dehydrogenase
MRDVRASLVQDQLLVTEGGIGTDGVTETGRLGGLAPLAAQVAAASAAEGERERRLAPAAVAALVDAGFARHFVPREHGGAEGGFAELLDAAAAVAEGCASAAWCGALWAAHGRYAARLPAAGRRAVWGGGPDVKIAAALVPPAGSAEAVPGGWRLTGRWSYVSGVDHADWLLLAAPVTGGGGTRVFALPRAACTVADTWDPVGLRGTGSHTVVLPPTVVPEPRSAPLDALLAGDPSDGAARCHRLPAHAVGGMVFCAPALGTARRALSLWRERTAGRPGLDEPYARAAAEVDAAAAVLHGVAARADDAGAGDLPRLEALGRRDAAYAAELLTRAVERLFTTGGSHAAAAPDELQRCWRDAHTIGGHAALRFSAAAASYARWEHAGAGR